MSENAAQDVNKQAKKGIRLLMVRQVVLQALTMVGGIVLARTLEPSVYGLYVIATFLVAAFALFGDFGLAPSLIQRKNDIGEKDIQVAFTLQQITTSILVILLIVTAPFLVHLYKEAPPETVWLVRALAFSLYLTSWRTMSALQLERKLKYDRLAWIEVGETVVFQGLAVILALMGKGVWSFVIATLARGVFGATLIYAVAPWRVRFAFDKETARQILKFGIPFQLGSIVHNVGGWITPVLVGGMIGPQAVGYLNWASSNGKKPLVIVDSIMRVAFPHFSRIQDDRKEVERMMSKYLTYLLIPAGIWFVVLLTAGHSLVSWIYKPKWNPAVPALTLYAFVVSLDVIVWVVSVSMNACGLAKLAAKRASVRTISHIVLALPLVHFLGFNGVPVAYLLTMVVTLPWTFQGLGAGTMKRVLVPLLWLLLPIMVSGLCGWATLGLHLHAAQKGLFCTAVVLLSYATTVLIAAPEWLKGSVRSKLIKVPKLSPVVDRILPGIAQNGSVQPKRHQNILVFSCLIGIFVVLCRALATKI